MKDSFLLLTGTIEVKGTVPFLKITSTVDRLNQYLKAIVLWIRSNNFKKICFCENSYYPVNWTPWVNYAKEHGVELEVLQFSGDWQKVSQKGKGFGEAEVIDYALMHSRFMPVSTGFWKCTGRFFVKDLEKAELLFPDENNIFLIKNFGIKSFINFFIKNIIRYEGHYHPYPSMILTSLFKTTTDFYKTYLTDIKHEVDDQKGLVIERVVYRRLKKFLSVFKKFKVLEKELVLIGISGTQGKSYAALSMDDVDPELSIIVSRLKDQK
jgi:hypothetical protein